MDETVADELDAMAERFDGLKGELVAAAVRMFLAAKPDQQREALTNVMTAKVARLFESASPIGVIGGRPTTAKGSPEPQSNLKGSSGRGSDRLKE